MAFKALCRLLFIFFSPVCFGNRKLPHDRSLLIITLKGGKRIKMLYIDLFIVYLTLKKTVEHQTEHYFLVIIKIGCSVFAQPGNRQPELMDFGLYTSACVGNLQLFKEK